MAALALAHGDVVVIPAVDRLSRDTTDLLGIARDMQRAGAGLRSLAEPVVDTTSDFAKLVLAMLGVATKLQRQPGDDFEVRAGRHDAGPNPNRRSANHSNLSGYKFVDLR